MINEIVPLIMGEIVEEYDPDPGYGDEIASRMLRTLGELPEGTILQSAGGNGWDALAYKCTTLEWTITGYAGVVSSDKLRQFSSSWIVVLVV